VPVILTTKKTPQRGSEDMATKVHMEALSPTMEEGQLVRWLKKEGDAVSNGDILAEIETDKATMELVARGDGVLRKVLLQEGDTAAVGAVIGIIAGEDEDIEGMVPEGADSSGSISRKEETGGSDDEEVSQAPEEGPEAEASEEPETSRKTADAPPDESDTGEGSGEETPPGDGRIKASPLARRMAEEANLDLSRIKGSGPGGRVVKRDVEDARESGAAEVSAEGARKRDSADGVVGIPDEDYEDVPLSQMRKTIAKRLVESIGPVPHFFLRISVDMTRILEARKKINTILEAEGEKVSINDFVLRAAAEALSRHPEVNAEWRGDSVRRHHRVHLGVAVAVEDGLITPVVRDANLKGLARISREVRELAARGREKRLQPEEYTGSTFSISNLGMFGIQEFTGVINPPEAGILAVGGVEDAPVAEEGGVVVRPIMMVTMSCDHRVVDGATGARFLQTLKGMLEEPAAILI